MSESPQLDGLPPLDPNEIEATGELLPEKTAMTTITVGFGFPIGNLAMPINLAHAMNSSSPESWAVADADQVVIVEQVDDGGMAQPPGHDK